MVIIVPTSDNIGIFYLMLDSHYYATPPIPGDRGDTCSYGSDALHGRLEEPMNRRIRSHPDG